MKFEVGYRTDPGPRKGANQDAIRVVAGEGHLDGIALILSDGMGGARAGERASEIAVSVIEEELAAAPPLTPTTASERLHRAILTANQSIYDEAQAMPEKQGMGCTIVAALILGNQGWIASVGDSRAYLIRGESSQQLTQDHTWVNARVRDGIMTREEAVNSGLRHVLDRALGTRPNVEVDVWPARTLEPGDVLLLCSDGLYGVLDDDELCATATAYPAQQAADRLVRQALDAHTHDNVSVVILQVRE